ncbi:MAG TPA: DUF6073 family protein [Thermoanaerobaculia bacterium]|nr:DUF6073 family protein [Thermoanaerobaculia bacterium]
MKVERKLWLALGVAALALGLSLVAYAGNNEDSYKVASLVRQMETLSPVQVESLDAIPMKPFTLNKPSVDVMRVRLDETYTVQGVGKDTVELSGWIAVRHGAPRPAPGFTKVSWETAITDTEFVALELNGESKLFGPVHVVLDSSRPAIGQVGRIDVPDRATRLLQVANSGQTQDQAAAGDVAQDCRAPVNVKVSMPSLGLEMVTREPAVWYSNVTTIPPVGHVASVTVDPVPMISGGRVVATLDSGIVKFREVVKKVELSEQHQILASK